MKLFKKILLSPIAFLFRSITTVRNRRYDEGKSRQTSFKEAVVVVGNLTVGGTGKTPHVEFLTNYFLNKKQIALVSRGYGRKTKGFVVATKESSANEIGDEPMQFFTKFGHQVTVAVGEKRVNAIERLLKHASYDLFLLDDAFQHRSLLASFYILLTDYGRLFTEDFVLPVGLLREKRKGASRANVIIVSKCPKDLSEIEQKKIIQNIRKYSQAPVFFTKMVSSNAKQFNSGEVLEDKSKVVTLSAIAQNELFIEEVAHKYEVLQSFSFRDHHSFSISELQEIVNYTQLHKLELVTTEKDYMRLSQPEFMDLTAKMSIFVIPIEVQFLSKQAEFLAFLEQGMISE
jgi:tetraacyldisaccharide 4'-kinase